MTAVTVQKTKLVVDPSTFSSWRKLIRVTARITRLAEEIRLGKFGQHQREGPLIPEGLAKAERFWIKEAQTPFHSLMTKGEFKNLSPFTDEQGVVRVGGRVDQAIMSYDTRHPVLLPSDHWISTLITRHAHQHRHSGVAATTAKTKYWILKATKLSNSVKCGFCKEMAYKTETQLMADLPALRLAPCTPPFYHTACDHFGPYTVKIGRSKTAKHYDVLFTCLNTRAVHLEMAVGYVSPNHTLLREHHPKLRKGHSRNHEIPTTELNLFRKLSTRSGSVGAEKFSRPWYTGNNGKSNVETCK